MKKLYHKICPVLKCNSGTLYVVLLAIVIRVSDVALL